MSTTLYRTYRPQTFATIVGQQHIVRTLTHALISGRIGQAFLFTGSRGTGKTTMARILARALNCSDRQGAEPCLACPHCLSMNEGRSMDVIEIDAASHTGVDNIRELRETVRLQPTLGTHKVYIIDEVHMLSTGAWNALLKTLEEPPAHVVFILATTEIHKIPDTILSRCQRFDFSRFPLEQIVTKLTSIAEQEHLTIDREALDMIALAAEGGMRDAESLLAQVIALEDQHITAAEVTTILGLTSQVMIERFLTALVEHEPASALAVLQELSEGGFDFSSFATSLLEYLRRLLIISVDTSASASFATEFSTEQLAILSSLAARLTPADVVRLIEHFQIARREIRLSPIPQLPLEIALVKYLYPATALPTPAPAPTPTPTPRPTPSPTKPTPPSPAQPITPPASTPRTTPPSAPTSTHTPSQTPSEPLPAFDVIAQSWDAIVRQATKQSPSIGFLLAGARPVTIEGHTVVLSVKFAMHRDRLSEPKTRLTLEEAFATIIQVHPTLRIITEEESSTPTLVSQALETLGGQVVG